MGRTSASICAFHAAEAQHAVDPLAGQGAGSPSAEVVAIHAAHGSFILRNSIRAREFAECARPFATIGRGDPLARLAAGSCGRRIMPDVAACVTFASRLVLRADLRTCVLSSARAQMQGVSLGTGRGRPAAGQCVLPLTRLRAHVPGQQADRRLSRRECVDGKCVACEGILADRFECMPHSQKWGFLFDLAELAAPCRETPCNQLPCITFISLRPARRDVGIDAPEEFGGAEP